MNDSSTPIGVTFGSLSVLGPRAIIDIAKRAAQLRYRSLWTVEATGTDAFTLLGAASAVAPELDLATGIVPIQLRSPPLMFRSRRAVEAIGDPLNLILEGTRHQRGHAKSKCTLYVYAHDPRKIARAHGWKRPIASK
jgi:hypothetical protein